MAAHTFPRSIRASTRVVALLTLVAASPLAAQAPAKPQAVPGDGQFATVRGLIIDSLHSQPLAHAVIRIDGSTRETMSDSTGEYHMDSLPPGSYRFRVLHALLDTIGISLVSDTITLVAGKRAIVDIGVPSSERLVQILCPAARLALGPAALVGFVRDADTEAPATGAKVSLLWYEGDPLGFKKTPRVREYPVGPDGRYKICGIPATMSGKLQVFRDGLSTGEVPVETKEENGVLALRSMSIASHESVQIAAAPVDTAPKGLPGDTALKRNSRVTNTARPKAKIVKGRARVSGRVLNNIGEPVVGARVDLQGTTSATITRADGSFTLDSLPSGTQTVEVRKLGYQVAEVPVELSSSNPAAATVKMDRFVATLETMRVEATREKGLQDVGFSLRKRTGMGHYLEGDQIPRTQMFSDALRAVPGVRVMPAGDGTGAQVITSSRDPTGMGCVNFYVDGTPWQQQFPGDIDQFIRSDEVAAIEVYSGAQTPAEFQTAGQSSCMTVVVWTQRRVDRKRNN